MMFSPFRRRPTSWASISNGILAVATALAAAIALSAFALAPEFDDGILKDQTDLKLLCFLALAVSLVAYVFALLMGLYVPFVQSPVEQREAARRMALGVGVLAVTVLAIGLLVLSELFQMELRILFDPESSPPSPGSCSGRLPLICVKTAM